MSPAPGGSVRPRTTAGWRHAAVLAVVAVVLATSCASGGGRSSLALGTGHKGVANPASSTDRSDALRHDPPGGPVPSTATTTTSTTAPVNPIREIGVPDPASDGRSRVLFVGDSLMFGAYPVLTALGRSRDVETRYVGFTATGLLSAQGWWLDGIKREVADFNPDIVVLESCCNYAINEDLYRLPDGSLAQPDSQEMFAAWAVNAREAVAQASAGGAHIYWVVTPNVPGIAPLAFQNRIERFNAIYRALGVPMIDWRAALEPDGVWTSVMNVDGDEVQVRARDGVHFAPAGDLVVSRATWDVIQPRLDLHRSR